MDPVHIVDLGIVVLISSVVGSRLLYVLGHLEQYRASPLDILKVWEGGLTFYGGLIAGVIFGIGYLKMKRLGVRGATDIIAPQIALGIAIARVGCFMNGCCFGTESHVPWACSFPPDSQAGWTLPGLSLHPTQIYSSIANLVIFLLLRRQLRSDHAPGTVFFTFLTAYGIWRFTIDFLRHYESHLYVTVGGAAMTHNQIVSIGLAVLGAVFLARSRSLPGSEDGS
jgi:phosphatidylglycerol:prolipoprotein diacylglycerol transferase